METPMCIHVNNVSHQIQSMSVVLDPTTVVIHGYQLLHWPYTGPAVCWGCWNGYPAWEICEKVVTQRRLVELLRIVRWNPARIQNPEGQGRVEMGNNTPVSCIESINNVHLTCIHCIQYVCNLVCIHVYICIYIYVYIHIYVPFFTLFLHATIVSKAGRPRTQVNAVLRSIVSGWKCVCSCCSLIRACKINRARSTHCEDPMCMCMCIYDIQLIHHTLSYNIIHGYVCIYIIYHISYIYTHIFCLLSWCLIACVKLHIWKCR